MSDVSLPVAKGYLLTWESDHGDEGEGREHVAVYRSRPDAEFASRTLERPPGFSEKGGYGVTPIAIAIRDPVNADWSDVEYGVMDEDSGRIQCISFSVRDAVAIACDDDTLYKRSCSDWESLGKAEDQPDA